MKDKFNPNNILGWTEQDFIEMKLELANTKLGNDEKLTPDLFKTWCNYAEDYFIKGGLNGNIV